MSRPTNYFKVTTPGEDRIFGFDTWDRGDIRGAFYRAVVYRDAARGAMSVFYPVPLSGPWDPVPSIVTAEAPLPVWRAPKPAKRMAAFGESWCF